jgi:hypothetical protein
MRPLLVVSPEKVRKTLYGFPDVGIVLYINLLILDGPPEPFNEDVVENPAFAVHTDGNGMVLENVGKFLA